MTNQMNTMTLLNGTGDITIGWTKDKHEQMKKMIEAKLQQGYVFFILRKQCLWKRRVRLFDVSQLDEPGVPHKVEMDDKEANALFSKGDISIGSTPSGLNIDKAEQSKDVDAIVRSDSILVRPIAAG